MPKSPEEMANAMIANMKEKTGQARKSRADAGSLLYPDHMA